MVPMKEFTSMQMKDLRILADFVRVFCSRGTIHLFRYRAACPTGELVQERSSLCPDCQALLEYALQKRRNCPLDPKPSCKKCHVHCYSKQYRSRIREIMAFFGTKNGHAWQARLSLALFLLMDEGIHSHRGI